MVRVLLLAALGALAAIPAAQARPPMETSQIVDGDGIPLGTAANPLNVVGGGGGGGGATGSVTPAGTNGTAAQAVQGINGGVPLAITGSFLLDTTFTGRINTLGQKSMAASTPVVLPSDQTVPISAAALPLPTGAATAAKQPALGTAGTAATDVLTVQGIAGGVAQNVIPPGITPTRAVVSVSAASIQLVGAGSTRRALQIACDGTGAVGISQTGATLTANTLAGGADTIIPASAANAYIPPFATTSPVTAYGTATAQNCAVLTWTAP